MAPDNADRRLDLHYPYIIYTVYIHTYYSQTPPSQSCARALAHTESKLDLWFVACITLYIGSIILNKGWHQIKLKDSLEALWMSVRCLQSNYRSDIPPWDPWLFRRVLSHFPTGISPRALWRPNCMQTAPAWRSQIYCWGLWLNNSVEKWCRDKIRLRVECAVFIFTFPQMPNNKCTLGHFYLLWVAIAG